ncbi:hypothetical protein H7F51_03440 [Novosphingobium flavum]|uniref:Glycosyltransferase family 2 protein n=1 Tax=Novosphingobium flavum TaxID=1778672 RepID=A0A7X1FPE7_9SPHN|nr:hypothetical protein [Novosphingobium flavum]MBC2664570.1 hypothetical protein [Novosphingobium flavum]
MTQPTALVVYAWNGRGQPLELVNQDVAPGFEVLLFDYSGTVTAPEAAGFPVLSRKTECKGEIYREVHARVSAAPERYDYVGLIDDDIALAWSDLERLLAIARQQDLDSFQAALTPDSFHAHHWLIARPGQTLRPLPWVEVMMPFYRTALFLAGGPFYARSISSYGLDQFVLPTLQKLAGLEKVAIIDAVVVRHTRAITSDDKVFANGLTAHQERLLQWRMARALVAQQRPDLVGTRWYFRTFSPLGGHHRYWPLRLAAPWLWLKRALRTG